MSANDATRATSAAEIEAHRRDVEQAYAARVARLRGESGWLALVAKIFLSGGTVTVGSEESAGARLPKDAPARIGTLTFDSAEKKLRFDAAPGVDVRIREGSATATATATATTTATPSEPTTVTSRVLRTDKDGAPDTLLASGFVLQIMERGDSLALRVRDLRELPRPFAGIDRYPIDPAWKKEARLVRHATPHPVTMDFEGATDGPVTDSMTSIGLLLFEHDGAAIELEALLDGDRIFVLYRDATSGTESYATGRFFYAPLPKDGDAGDDRVTLDFNRGMLPGCAFTDHATCPIPPRKNRLQIAIRAGEKNYAGEPIH